MTRISAAAQGFSNPFHRVLVPQAFPKSQAFVFPSSRGINDWPGFGYRLTPVAVDQRWPGLDPEPVP